MGHLLEAKTPLSALCVPLQQPSTRPHSTDTPTASAGQEVVRDFISAVPSDSTEVQAHFGGAAGPFPAGDFRSSATTQPKPPSPPAAVCALLRDCHADQPTQAKDFGFFVAHPSSRAPQTTSAEQQLPPIVDGRQLQLLTPPPHPVLLPPHQSPLPQSLKSQKARQAFHEQLLSSSSSCSADMNLVVASNNGGTHRGRSSTRPHQQKSSPQLTTASEEEEANFAKLLAESPLPIFGSQDELASRIGSLTGVDHQQLGGMINILKQHIGGSRFTEILEGIRSGSLPLRFDHIEGEAAADFAVENSSNLPLTHHQSADVQNSIVGHPDVSNDDDDRKAAKLLERGSAAIQGVAALVGRSPSPSEPEQPSGDAGNRSTSIVAAYPTSPPSSPGCPKSHSALVGGYGQQSSTSTTNSSFSAAEGVPRSVVAAAAAAAGGSLPFLDAELIKHHGGSLLPSRVHMPSAHRFSWESAPGGAPRSPPKVSRLSKALSAMDPNSTHSYSSSAFGGGSSSSSSSSSVIQTLPSALHTLDHPHHHPHRHHHHPIKPSCEVTASRRSATTESSSVASVDRGRGSAGGTPASPLMRELISSPPENSLDASAAILSAALSPDCDMPRNLPLEFSSGGSPNYPAHPHRHPDHHHHSDHPHHHHDPDHHPDHHQEYYHHPNHQAHDDSVLSGGESTNSLRCTALGSYHAESPAASLTSPPQTTSQQLAIVRDHKDASLEAVEGALRNLIFHWVSQCPDGTARAVEARLREFAASERGGAFPQIENLINVVRRLSGAEGDPELPRSDEGVVDHHRAVVHSRRQRGAPTTDQGISNCNYQPPQQNAYGSHDNEAVDSSSPSSASSSFNRHHRRHHHHHGAQHSSSPAAADVESSSAPLFISPCGSSGQGFPVADPIPPHPHYQNHQQNFQNNGHVAQAPQNVEQSLQATDSFAEDLSVSDPRDSASKKCFVKLLVSEEICDSFKEDVALLARMRVASGATMTISPKGVYFPGSQDRVLAISGGSETAIFCFVDYVIDKIYQMSQSDVRNNIKPRCKIAVPRAVVGSLIGKKGCHIQSVRIATGAHVYVSPLFVRADEACSERLVTVSSRDLVNLRTATISITRKINEHLDRNSCRTVVYNNRKPPRQSAVPEANSGRAGGAAGTGTAMPHQQNQQTSTNSAAAAASASRNKQQQPPSSHTRGVRAAPAGEPQSVPPAAILRQLTASFRAAGPSAFDHHIPPSVVEYLQRLAAANNQHVFPAMQPSNMSPRGAVGGDTSARVRHHVAPEHLTLTTPSGCPSGASSPLGRVPIHPVAAPAPYQQQVLDPREHQLCQEAWGPTEEEAECYLARDECNVNSSVIFAPSSFPTSSSHDMHDAFYRNRCDSEFGFEEMKSCAALDARSAGLSASSNCRGCAPVDNSSNPDAFQHSFWQQACAPAPASPTSNRNE